MFLKGVKTLYGHPDAYTLKWPIFWVFLSYFIYIFAKITLPLMKVGDKMKDTFKNTAKNIGKGLLYIFIGGCVIGAASAECNSEVYTIRYEEEKPRRRNRNKHNGRDKGLGKAIIAINESDMWSSDKEKAISAIKHGYAPDVYYAVENIAESDMWSSDKVKCIKNLFQESE